MNAGLQWVDEHRAELVDLAQAIWEYAEVGLKEVRSARAQAALLEREGFSTRLGIAGMPSALVAEFGEGKPVIGFLGEYDALPGLSQKVSPRQEPVTPGGAGHGCGHNLLGVGAVGAAIALKCEIEAGRLEGTVKYFGCPAEETAIGKVFMAKHGAFDGLDAAITWHPAPLNTGWYGSSLAVNSARFAYHGRTAHAGSSPHMGISALDAVELFNVGANYLREHVVEDARIHYVTLQGGHEPNVVPDFSEVWYYVRASSRLQVEEVYQRLLQVAGGASLMTGARLEVKFQTGAYELLPNGVMSDLMMECLRKVGAPRFTEEEKAFARQVERTFAPGQKKAALNAMRIPPEYGDVTLHEEVAPPVDRDSVMRGSTDVGDVSWITPTGQIRVVGAAMGSAGHSWQNTATAGMGIGHKGMIVAAKTMALAGYELLTRPELRERAWVEFRRASGGRRYASPLPEGLDVPGEQLEE